MNARTFDPLFFDHLDEGFAANEDVDGGEEITYVTLCPICGGQDLVLELDGTLVDLEGIAHKCPPCS